MQAEASNCKPGSAVTGAPPPTQARWRHAPRASSTQEQKKDEGELKGVKGWEQCDPRSVQEILADQGSDFAEGRPPAFERPNPASGRDVLHFECTKSPLFLARGPRRG